MKYTQTKILGASLCGADVCLSMIGACSLIEDSLTEFTGELKIDGPTVMREYNAVWLFTKNHIKFLKPIRWKEKITVESIVSQKSAIRLYIDTCIKNSLGEIAVYSRVEMCGIDKDAHSIRKIETMGVGDNIETSEPLCEIKFFPKERQDVTFTQHVCCKASNIDYAHHTNNVEYIRFLTDTFSYKDLINRPIKELEINYLNQSFEGDELSIFKGEVEERIFFEIKKGEEHIIKCQMRL